jgi:carbonic anhydrase
VRQTIHLIANRSRILADAIASAHLAIVGAEYALHDGRATIVESIGL